MSKLATIKTQFLSLNMRTVTGLTRWSNMSSRKSRPPSLTIAPQPRVSDTRHCSRNPEIGSACAFLSRSHSSLSGPETVLPREPISFCAAFRILIGTYRYFLSKILDNVGIHDTRVKNEINLAMTCWGFVNATILALTMPKLKRRTVYLVRSVIVSLGLF